MFSGLGGKIYFDSLSLDLVLCVRYQAICILCMCCIFHGGGGGEGELLPYISHIAMCPPKGGVSAPFWSERLV